MRNINSLVPEDFEDEAIELLIQEYHDDGGTNEDWTPDWGEIANKSWELWNDRMDAYGDWADGQAADQRMDREA